MAGVKTSLICTVLNEEKSIERFIISVIKQTEIPSELVIIDGGSKDKTKEVIEKSAIKFKNKLSILLFVKKGNRSIGRNEAIKRAKSEIILITDSGNLLDKNWVREIIKPFKNKKVGVVAGYYKGLARNAFQEALVPYVLVMPDKIDKNFLPATRSMALKKSVWKKINGFDEKLSHNEDYDFANKIVKNKIEIAFTKNAIVNWEPRKDIKQAFIMFFRFAFGDAEAGILRTKVIFQFLRYLLFFYFSFLSFVYKSAFLSLLTISSSFLYILWSILKNSKYVKSYKKIIYLPFIQITADLAVILGTTLGLLKKIINFPYLNSIKKNKGYTAILVAYVLIVLSQINWGIPNNDHPFLYHMDEWHQLQSVRNVFKFGTPNLPGAANGTMFHFFYSGLYLMPFILLHIVNPFAIRSAIDNIPVQHNLFLILRIETLILGVLTTFIIYKISKVLKINSIFSVLFFIFTPIWLMLSNYFKYDIGLAFWLSLSLYSMIKYYKEPTTKNFVMSGIFSALALSIKVSALPILGVYVFSYLLFTKDILKNYKRFILGILSFIFVAAVFGSPDLVFGGRNMNDYLYSNLVQVPNSASNLKLSYSNLSYIFLYHFPTIFGHAFYVIFILSLFYFFSLIKKNIKLYSFFIISLLIFLISLTPLRIFIEGNRALVLLPYMIIIFGISLKTFIEKYTLFKNKLLILILIVIIIFQVTESLAWVSMKYTISPQQASSKWVLTNIPSGSGIGIENIPLYQAEPDFVLKEFYNKQYNPNLKTIYKYFIVDKSSKTLPEYVILSDTNLSVNYEKSSPKIDLINKLKEKEYKLVVKFIPQLTFYNIFGDDFVFRHSGMIGFPSDVSIYEKK